MKRMRKREKRDGKREKKCGARKAAAMTVRSQDYSLAANTHISTRT